MSDNAIRALRVALKGLVPLIASGAIDQIVKAWLDEYNVGGAARVTVFMIVAYVTSLIVDTLEDKSGKALFGLAPLDRKAGDALIGDGLGDKKGKIVGDTNPTVATEYVEPLAA